MFPQWFLYSIEKKLCYSCSVISLQPTKPPSTNRMSNYSRTLLLKKGHKLFIIKIMRIVWTFPKGGAFQIGYFRVPKPLTFTLKTRVLKVQNLCCDTNKFHFLVRKWNLFSYKKMKLTFISMALRLASLQNRGFMQLGIISLFFSTQFSIFIKQW